ncbi:MAG: hypothetical protein AAB952_00880 [Patescibacteria group bacterium]
MNTAHLHLPPVGSRFFLDALGAFIPRVEAMKGARMVAKPSVREKTFTDVPSGSLFDTEHLGKRFSFLKLRNDCFVSNFRRADPLDPRQSRQVNAVFLREGELIYIPNPELERRRIQVSNIRAPAVKSYHRLRDNLFWFQWIGNQWIEVNVVREEPDDVDAFGGLSGTLEYNKDFAKPPVGCRH